MDKFLLARHAMQQIRSADLQTALVVRPLEGVLPSRRVSTSNEATARLRKPGSVNATMCLLMVSNILA